jgi:Asp-tRNA(Asn)/Glu-tRNA(Gln) amidotransferase A subunit family amidase
MKVFAWESQWPMRAYRMSGDAMLGARLHQLIDTASRMSREDYEAALRFRMELQDGVRDAGSAADGFISLASSGPAPPGLEETGSRVFPTAWTLSGGPSCSLPVLAVEGLPLGMQLMGREGTDPGMIAAARWVMNCLVTGWDL